VRPPLLLLLVVVVWRLQGLLAAVRPSPRLKLKPVLLLLLLLTQLQFLTPPLDLPLTDPVRWQEAHTYKWHGSTDRAVICVVTKLPARCLMRTLFLNTLTCRL
jgi:hypothetical protein